MSIQMTYLAHSGFAVETATKVLVFDYYQDEQRVVRRYADGDKPLWFFVSHWHGDHFIKPRPISSTRTCRSGRPRRTNCIPWKSMIRAASTMPS